MSEFFLELFSEEIPSNLQQNLREDLLKSFNDFFLEKSILFKKSSSYSTPNRLVVLFEGVQKNVVLKSEEIKGPNIKSPEVALEGFVRSNKIVKKDLYQKKTDKGEFYFFKTKSKKLHTHELLEEFIPILLNKIQWKKSMYWGTFDLNWGRPLKSILAVFDKKKLNFNFHHLTSLKSMNYFKGLGSYFDKAQRMRKLGGMISDELLISKEKVELSASICKVDLLSELVGEFPELQGVMGGYFANAQGFDKDLALAISEQYLPTGSGSRVPKKPFSIALSLADKIDTLVGFFGLNQKPTSSKDPYALRRLALGVIRIIVENKKDFKIKDLINYSLSLYLDQGFEIDNQSLQNELSDFLMDRLKYHMKEENIRNDIIQASTSSFNLDQSVIIFNKAKHLNKIINKPNGLDIIASYKRASNILDGELKKDKIELSNTTDPGIFKTELEKNLFKKISELRKYFSGINKDENYVQTLDNLASVKREVFDFFDNVIVNEDDLVIKKNRLELIQMMCKTFNNYVNFALIDSR